MIEIEIILIMIVAIMLDLVGWYITLDWVYYTRGMEQVVAP